MHRIRKLPVLLRVKPRLLRDHTKRVDHLPAVPAPKPPVVLREQVLPRRHAVLLLQAVETIVRIIKENRAINLRPIPVRLFIRGRLIQRQNIVRILACPPANSLFIILQIRMREQNKRTALLGIVAMNDRLLIVHALLPEIVRRIGQNIPINRHMMLRLLLPDQCLRGNLPEVFQRRAAISSHQLLTRLQSFVKQPIGMRRLDGRDRRTLQDRPPEQA